MQVKPLLREISIRIADLSEIVDLRYQVLRAGLPREMAVFPGDELATSRHFGAFGTGMPAISAVGCATLHLNQWENTPAWQLRGMACAPDYRGMGLGRMLLEAVERSILDDAAAPRPLWCNARTPAQGFYTRMGWKVVSEPFEIATAGPHVRMIRRL